MMTYRSSELEVPLAGRNHPKVNANGRGSVTAAIFDREVDR
jgi:hypothetical protein